MGTSPIAAPLPKTTISLFSGRYQQGSGNYAFAAYAGWEAFLQAKQKADTQGLRLCGINVYEDSQSITWYTGVWIESSAGFGYWTGTDWNGFMQQFQQSAGKGLGLVDINFAILGGTLSYTGVYLGNPGKQVLVHDLSWSDLMQQQQAQNANGLVLIKVQCRVDSSNNFLYTGLFQAGATANNGVYAGGSWAEYYTYFQGDPGRDNVNCLQVLDYGLQGNQWIVATYAPGSQPTKFVLGQDWDSFNAQWKSLSAQGYRLQSVEVQQKPVNWQGALQQVLSSRAVGYSFGVNDNGQTIEIGAFGDAVQPSSSFPSGVQMTETTPLTLGSVSKLIEAVAMLFAIQTGQYGSVSLSTPFFQLIDGHYGISDSDVTDQRVKQITILDLLTHSAALDDPPGPQNTSETLWAYIKVYVGQTLNPQKVGPNGEIGVVYCYSNAAFQTIRGVVQAITGAATYQAWVTQAILSPIGMNSTYIPVPGQAYNIRYYERNLVISPPWDGAPEGIIPNEASWNSTAADMLKLMAALRGTGLLNQNSMSAMLTPRSLPYQYNTNTGQRQTYDGQICLGFDATPTPAPAYLAKNGSYTNYSQSAVVRFTSPPIDVVIQANTDTATVPGTAHGNEVSVRPESVIVNTFPQMYF